ncbi:hypothetical protein HYU45_01170 [Candidatus Daviesbacteria bacterium]|nr:hypothetical protein [Candidatus Daviesbacteria bacterium]
MDYRARSDIWQSDEALKVGQAISPTNRSRVLARFRQIFPLVLFPDDLIIEELRIIWVRRDGPWAEEIISIMATDIASVDASAGPLLGRIHVKSLTGGPEILVDNFSRGDVYRIRCLVEGIALAARAGLKVDVEDLETKKELLAKAGFVKLH